MYLNPETEVFVKRVAKELGKSFTETIRVVFTDYCMVNNLHGLIPVMEVANYGEESGI